MLHHCQLINHITCHKNAITALTLNTSMHDLILNHLALSSLDADTHRAWELHSSKEEELPSTEQVITFLEQRCKALELLQTSQLTTTAAPGNKYTSASDNKVSRTAHTYVTNYIRCLLCKE